MKYSIISREELNKIIKEGAILIDVRTPLEYNNKHIDNAINIPSNIILTNIQSKYSKDIEIVLYCSSGVRSRSVANNLIRLGYNKIYVYDWNGQ